MPILRCSRRKGNIGELFFTLIGGSRILWNFITVLKGVKCYERTVFVRTVLIRSELGYLYCSTFYSPTVGHYIYWSKSNKRLTVTVRLYSVLSLTKISKYICTPQRYHLLWYLSKHRGSFDCRFIFASVSEHITVQS
jgi:hypothetical protein